MEENNNDINKSCEKNNKVHYSDTSGTGVLASMIFMIVTTVIMYFVSKFLIN